MSKYEIGDKVRFLDRFEDNTVYTIVSVSYIKFNDVELIEIDGDVKSHTWYPANTKYLIKIEMPDMIFKDCLK